MTRPVDPSGFVADAPPRCPIRVRRACGAGRRANDQPGSPHLPPPKHTFTRQHAPSGRARPDAPTSRAGPRSGPGPHDRARGATPARRRCGPRVCHPETACCAVRAAPASQGWPSRRVARVASCCIKSRVVFFCVTEKCSGLIIQSIDLHFAADLGSISGLCFLFFP